MRDAGCSVWSGDVEISERKYSTHSFSPLFCAKTLRDTKNVFVYSLSNLNKIIIQQNVFFFLLLTSHVILVTYVIYLRKTSSWQKDVRPWWQMKGCVSVQFFAVVHRQFWSTSMEIQDLLGRDHGLSCLNIVSFTGAYFTLLSPVPD